MRPSYDASEFPRVAYFKDSQQYYKSYYNCAFSPRTNDAPRLKGYDKNPIALSAHNGHRDKSAEKANDILLIKTQSGGRTETGDSNTAAS